MPTSLVRNENPHTGTAKERCNRSWICRGRNKAHLVWDIECDIQNPWPFFQYPGGPVAPGQGFYLCVSFLELLWVTDFFSLCSIFILWESKLPFGFGLPWPFSCILHQHLIGLFSCHNSWLHRDHLTEQLRAISHELGRSRRYWGNRYWAEGGLGSLRRSSGQKCYNWFIYSSLFTAP